MTKNKNPLVSIIVPTYNGEEYLNECLQSIFDQTYKNLEVIIIDDNSHNKFYVKNIAAKFSNLKIKIVMLKSNQGVANAMNIGIKNSKGKFINWLSHDDYFHPMKIQKQLELIDFEDDSICYCNFITFNDDSNTQRIIKPIRINKQYIDLWLIFNDRLHGCSLLIPSKFFDTGFDKNLKHTQDYAKWHEFVLKYKFVYLDESLLYSRNHSNQTSKLFKYESIQEKELLYLNMLNCSFKKRKSIDLKLLINIFFTTNMRGYRFMNTLFIKNRIGKIKLTQNIFKSSILKIVVFSSFPLLLLLFYLKIFLKGILRFTKMYV